MNEKIIAAILGATAIIIAALITAGHIGHIITIIMNIINPKYLTNLEKKALKSLKDYYDRDPDALMPADDFIKALKLDSDTGDNILQGLRKKNLTTAF